MGPVVLLWVLVALSLTIYIEVAQAVWGVIGFGDIGLRNQVLYSNRQLLFAIFVWAFNSFVLFLLVCLKTLFPNFLQ